MSRLALEIAVSGLKIVALMNSSFRAQYPKSQGSGSQVFSCAKLTVYQNWLLLQNNFLFAKITYCMPKLVKTVSQKKLIFSK